MQYIFRRHPYSALNLSAGRTPQPHITVTTEHTSTRILIYLSLWHHTKWKNIMYGVGGQAHTRTNHLDLTEDVWTPATFITPFLFCRWYTLCDGNSLTVSILTLSKSLTCRQRSCRVAIGHQVWNYVQKTVTQRSQFTGTHGASGHTSVHSTPTHTARFQALYSLMSL
jgi:hypothetical protein